MKADLLDLIVRTDDKIHVQCEVELDDKKMTDESEYSVRLISKDSIQNFEANSQVDVFVDVLKTLIRDYDLKNNISIPYAPGSKRAILNTSPENIDGSDMHSFHEVPKKLYLNTNLNREEKIRYIIRFAGECNVDIYYSGWK